MILTVDIGNTDTVCVLYDKEKKIKRRGETQIDGMRAMLTDLSVYAIETVIASSVVPSLTAAFEALCFEIWHRKPILISQSNTVSFQSELRHPEEIGADLIASAVGGRKYCTGAYVVVDMGTAIKLTVINADDVFLGGILIPGLVPSMQGLMTRIPHLPQVDLRFPPAVIGRTTEHAIQSGLMTASFYQIKGLLQAIELEIQTPVQCILTGGHSSMFKHLFPTAIWVDDLVNEGLYQLVLDKRVHDD